MNPDNINAIGTNTVLVITAVTSLVAAIAALKANEKAKETILISKEVGERVDGKLAEFVQLTKDSSRAEGVLEGKEKAEVLAKVAADLMAAKILQPIPVKVEDSVPVKVRDLK